jgi:UDP-GlcNAc:undecaprenyl-phosphate GlcNAc-1-phosphate transferase
MEWANIWIYIGVLSVVYFIILFSFKLILRQKWIQYIFDNQIRNRDIHNGIKPKIGGLIIIPTFISSIVILASTGLLSWQNEFWGMILGSIGILIYGYIDEKLDLNWSSQFIWQFGIAGIVIWSGVGIQAINLPNGDLWFIDSYKLLGMIFPQDIITALWIVGLMNVVNWLDGIDGLAGGVGVIGFLTLFLLSLTLFVNQPHIALISIVLVGCYLGFLNFNWYPSKIFLGTYGSMFLGYMLAILSLISGGKIATSALVLAFPIIDAIVVISQRIWNKNSIFKADNRHFHHKLLQAGLSQRISVVIMYAISIMFGVSALILETRGKLIIFIVGMIALILFSLSINKFIVKNTKR